MYISKHISFQRCSVESVNLHMSHVWMFTTAQDGIMQRLYSVASRNYFCSAIIIEVRFVWERDNFPPWLRLSLGLHICTFFKCFPIHFAPAHKSVLSPLLPTTNLTMAIVQTYHDNVIFIVFWFRNTLLVSSNPIEALCWYCINVQIINWLTNTFLMKCCHYTIIQMLHIIIGM